MYLIFILISFLLAFFNPYIGLFSIFTAVQALLCFVFVVNATSRFGLYQFAEALGQHEECPAILKAVKRTFLGALIVSCALFLVVVFVFLLVWTSAVKVYEGSMLLSPLDFLGLQYKFGISMVMLVISLAANLMAVVSVFVLRKRTLGKENAFSDVQQLRFENASFKVGGLTIASICAAVVLPLLTTKFSVIAGAINLFFFLFIFIIKVNLAGFKKFLDKNNMLSIQSKYAIMRMCAGGKNNSMCVLLCWGLAVMIILMGLLVPVGTVSLVQLPALPELIVTVVSVVFVVLSALCLSRDIRRIRI